MTIWVFFISLAFVGFYIFIEARPKGSNLFKVSLILLQFFRKRRCSIYPKANLVLLIPLTLIVGSFASANTELYVVSGTY